jgi:MOSC domain-containing protein YiiM
VAHIFSLNCSDGGVPKLPIREARVTEQGLEGDRQKNVKIHGGPERALCLYALEHIVALQEEGHPIFPGSVGENVTIAGLPWEMLVPGRRLRLGEVEIELTSFTTPCKTIQHSFTDQKYGRISQRLEPGMSRLYARVLHEGLLRVGDTVTLLNDEDGR